MRWFKHAVASWDDEKLSLFVDEHGLTGYGFWWRLLEIVAARIDEDNDAEVTFPVSKWGKMFGTYPKVFRKFCESLRNHSLIVLEDSGISITVKIPNLLKYRDEWSRKRGLNSGVAPEPLRSKEEESDTESELDKKETTSVVSKENVSPRGSRLAPDWKPAPELLLWAKDLFPDIDATLETESFHDYWCAKPGRDAVKLDWPSTWKNWIRRARPKPRTKLSSHPGGWLPMHKGAGG